MRVPALPDRDAVEIVFPAWAPGSYLVRDFVRHVYRLAVTDGRGRPLPAARVVRLDKQRWRIRDRRAPVPGPLPGVRLRGQRAHLVPRRQPRLLERHQPVLLRRRRARAPLPGRPSSRRRARAGGSRPRCRAVAGARAAPTRPPTSTSWSTRRSRSGRTRSHAFSVGRTRFELALYGRTNADPARLVDILRRVVARDRADLRRVPVSPLPLHRARAARRVGRARAPRLGDDGHRGAVVRGRGRLPALRRSGRARVLPRLERQAHPRRRARRASTTRARTTPACSGSTRGSPTTSRT